ncbi:hypothetical protein C8F01DRAFT_1267065 [Mycena amicta]|nr:hypothetical protein C8F01DRAFT_1267065 [Mycena amicta]
MALTRSHLLEDLNYLGRQDFALTHSWTRLGGKDSLAETGTNNSVFIVVGMVSAAKFKLSGLGSWTTEYGSTTPVESAKFNLVLENPESTEWLRDWDVVLSNAERIQDLICDSSLQAHFRAREDGREVIRFTRYVFGPASARPSADDHSQWPVPVAHQDLFNRAAAVRAFQLPVILDVDGSRIVGPELLVAIDELPGCIVAVKYSVGHNPPRTSKGQPARSQKDNANNFKHSFLAAFESIRIVLRPSDIVPFHGIPIVPQPAPAPSSSSKDKADAAGAAPSTPKGKGKASESASHPISTVTPYDAAGSTHPISTVTPAPRTPQRRTVVPAAVSSQPSPFISGNVAHYDAQFSPTPGGIPPYHLAGRAAHLAGGPTIHSSFLSRPPTPAFSMNNLPDVYSAGNGYIRSSTPAFTNNQSEFYPVNGGYSYTSYDQAGPSTGYYNFPPAAQVDSDSAETLSNNEDEEDVVPKAGLGKTRPAAHQGGKAPKRLRTE